MSVDDGEVTKHAGGRPRKFKSAEEMQEKIDDYYESCWEDRYIRDSKGNILFDCDEQPIKERQQVRPYTVTGLAVALNTTRQLLMRYEDDDDFIEFRDTIKHAKAVCENFAEENLYNCKNPAGIIFSMKNNYGWKDKQETELTGPNGQPLNLGLDVVIDYGDKPDKMINVTPDTDKLAEGQDSDE